jgi:hypothetical protein
MIVVFGEGRGFRVVWLLRLAYRLRSVDLLAGVEKDPEFLAINPGGVHTRNTGRRRHNGRVDCNHGISARSLWANAARAGVAQCRLP